jgi:hypothetical protein
LQDPETSTSFDQVFIQENEDITSDDTKDEENKLDLSTDTTLESPRKKPKQHNISEEDKVMWTAAEVLEGAQLCLPRSASVDDHIEKFGQFVISEMKQIKSPKNILEAKRSIQNIIFDIQTRELYSGNYK